MTTQITPAILCFAIATLVLMNQQAAASLPRLDPQTAHLLNEVQEGPDVQGDAFELMVRYVLEASGDEVDSDDPVRIRIQRESLLESPDEARGDVFRIRGRLIETRRLPDPHQAIEEWMIRLVSGEPLIVYLPASNASGFSGDGRVVSIDARFFRNIELRSRDGRLRAYPTFFGVSASAVGRAETMVLEQMDILMLLGFMVLLVIVGLAVVVFARRQGWQHSAREARVIETGSPIADDPVAALKELRDRNERTRS